jgi:hypothetical protein
MSRIANKVEKARKIARLHAAGMRLCDIAAQMGIDRETARYLFKCAAPSEMKFGKPTSVPVMTLGGVLWNWPPMKPSRAGGNKEEGVCEACELLAQCNAHVHGSPNGFIGCERPLSREMIAPGQVARGTAQD